MKFIVFTGISLCSQLLTAQAGINTKIPQATLDIVAKYPTGNLNAEIKEGLLIPRIDRARAQAMSENLPLTTESTLIYVNNVSTGSAAGSAVNITKKGFYYFSEKKRWVAFGETDKGVFADQMVTTQFFVPDYHSPDIVSHTVSTYDNNGWWLISKTNHAFQKSFAQQEMEYEYQGKPLDINNLHPQVTVLDVNGGSRIITATLISVENNGSSGKTRLKMSVARIDGVEGWRDTLRLNVLFVAGIN